MAEQYDFVIRGGLVVDGSGAEPRRADVAVSHGIITAVGEVEGRGREEIDASGLLVTPGFVDLHTHYDGQAICRPASILRRATASPPLSWAIAE